MDIKLYGVIDKSRGKGGELKNIFRSGIGSWIDLFWAQKKIACFFLPRVMVVAQCAKAPGKQGYVMGSIPAV